MFQYQIKRVAFGEIEPIWRSKLWPDRESPIEPYSAMIYGGGIDMKNFDYPPYFWGAMINTTILIGVNSGHLCSDNGFRSRGLWVAEEYRGHGIGKSLLLETIAQARSCNAKYVWSYPRQSSWSVYESAGFLLTSDWAASETSTANAYCKLDL